MHVLQVCNVGSIVGGTAACAWSLTRAWPQLRHTVAFLSPVDSMTRQVFQPHPVATWPHCGTEQIQSQQPDLVILHNISPAGASLWSGACSIQYVHSVGTRLVADQTLYCSDWLARQCRAPGDSVVWQGVPVPVRPVTPRVRGSDRLRIGRICTPSLRKWPDTLPVFYSHLASRHPQVDWEFVGCPISMQSPLQAACRGQATFYASGWNARSLLWDWDALLYHHPSLTESFGRTLAEAARAGCVPIVDQRGGFSEQLDIISGMGCRTLAEFSDSISALSDPEARRCLSQQVQSQANSTFSIEAFGRRMSLVVERLASRPVSTYTSSPCSINDEA